MRIFISGPMTGIKDYNFSAFNKAERILSFHGYEVVNPVKICKKYKKERVLADKVIFQKMVDEELEELKKCDSIYLLDGWENSTGALKEYEVAVDKNLTILKQSDFLK